MIATWKLTSMTWVSTNPDKTRVSRRASHVSLNGLPAQMDRVSGRGAPAAGAEAEAVKAFVVELQRGYWGEVVRVPQARAGEQVVDGSRTQTRAIRFRINREAINFPPQNYLQHRKLRVAASRQHLYRYNNKCIMYPLCRGSRLLFRI